MKPRSALPSTARLLLAAAGLALCASAGAAEPAATPDPSHVYVQGMKVGIDPVTGRIRPLSAEEAAQLRATLLPAQARGLRGPANEAEALQTMRPAAAGGVAIDVPEDRMSTLVATQRSDGSIAIVHAGADTHDTAPVSPTREQDHE